MQDWLDIDFAIQMNVDFIAVSFVKTADVIHNLKSYLRSRSDKVIEIVAKIESHDSVPNAQDIIEASDAIMIARGDLGNHHSHLNSHLSLFWFQIHQKFKTLFCFFVKHFRCFHEEYVSQTGTCVQSMPSDTILA